MRIKICGLMNFFDADYALHLGATELGFIFTESARRIDVDSARPIINQLPKSARTIGVFRDTNINDVIRICDLVGLKGAQLHGQETPAEVCELKKRRPNLQIFKTIGVDDETFNADPNEYQMCDAILFDSSVSHESPLKRRPIHSKALKELRLEVPFYIAGSITSVNVQAMIKAYAPDGIDLSSGVEINPGLKDPKLMQKFFQKLKGNI